MSKQVIAVIGTSLLGCSCSVLSAHQIDLVSPSTEVFRNIVEIVGWDKTPKRHKLGSGVIFPDGTAITDCHILRRVRRLGVQQGTSYSQASLVREDRDRDLCKLQVSYPERFAPIALKMRLVRDVSVGEPVYAIGVSVHGKTNAIEGKVARIQRLGEDRVIWISPSLAAGYSGGALFDRFGSLIGITTYRVRRGGELSYAYPAEYALSTKHASLDRLQQDLDPGRSESRPTPRSSAAEYNPVVRRYLDRVAEVSRKNLTYPEEARQQGWTGESSISFRFDSAGELSESYVNVSSGYAALDVTALLAVRKAISELPVPQLAKEKDFTGSVVIPFSLPEQQPAAADTARADK
jgi:TonB family protein